MEEIMDIRSSEAPAGNLIMLDQNPLLIPNLVVYNRENINETFTLLEISEKYQAAMKKYEEIIEKYTVLLNKSVKDNAILISGNIYKIIGLDPRTELLLIKGSFKFLCANYPTQFVAGVEKREDEMLIRDAYYKYCGIDKNKDAYSAANNTLRYPKVSLLLAEIYDVLSEFNCILYEQTVMKSSDNQTVVYIDNKNIVVYDQGTITYLHHDNVAHTKYAELKIDKSNCSDLINEITTSRSSGKLSILTRVARLLGVNNGK